MLDRYSGTIYFNSNLLEFTLEYCDVVDTRHCSVMKLHFKGLLKGDNTLCSAGSLYHPQQQFPY